MATTPDAFATTLIRVGDTERRMVAQVIRCRDCGATDQITSANSKSTLPTAAVARKFAQRGWHLGQHRNRDLCPACAHPKKPKKEAPMTTKPPETPARPAPSKAASKSITDLYLYLEDHYDRDKKLYRNGWTDEKIAAELGLSVTVVSARREQDFGPLVKDTLADEMRKASAALDKSTRALVTYLGQIEDLRAAVLTDHQILQEYVLRGAERIASTDKS